MGKKKWSESGKPNEDICQFLRELAEYEKNVSRNVHKSMAYRKAAATLEGLPRRVTSAADAKALPGIGVKISEKIEEFLSTGKVAKISKIRNDASSSAIQELTRVSGIGPAAARTLYEQGITSIEELRKNQGSLTHHQKLGLQHLEDFEKRIPRDEIEQLETRLHAECNALDPNYQAVICGSYRRGAASSGDVDLLVCHKMYQTLGKRPQGLLSRLVEGLRAAHIVTDTMSLGDTKFAGVYRLNPSLPYRRLDIRLLPRDQFFCGLLYFTGSDLFNQSMRAHAQQQGFTLSEYALRPIGCTGTPGEPVPVASERDIFDWLSLPYWEPHQRNGPVKE